jgi:hypothetical protein
MQAHQEERENEGGGGEKNESDSCTPPRKKKMASNLKSKFEELAKVGCHGPLPHGLVMCAGPTT